MRFEDKVVWITGASAGIGRAMALRFAREGAHLALSARREDRLAELVAEIEALDRRALAVPCDVTDDATVADAVARTVDHFGHLDVAVANAGYGATGPTATLDLDIWRRQFDVNVLGVISTFRHAFPALLETRGRIALMSSVAAFVYGAKAAPYSASKAAVHAIGATLSMELQGSGVSCTTVYPGFVASEIAQVDPSGAYRPDWKDRRPAQLMWATDDAARVIVRAIHRRKREFIFTGHGKLGVFMARHLPATTHLMLSRGGAVSYKEKTGESE